MATELAVGLSFVGMVVLAVSVLGTVHRRERFAFVPGVLLVIVGMTYYSGALAGLLSFVGLALVFASTVPMLRE